jgi:hypothetical protein
MHALAKEQRRRAARGAVPADPLTGAAGDDPDAEKRALEQQHCDPTIREPFIAALTDGSQTRR